MTEKSAERASLPEKYISTAPSSAILWTSSSSTSIRASALGAGAGAAASVALAGAGSGGSRPAGRIGQHGHDAGHRHNLIIQLLLLHAGIIDVLDLNAYPFGQALTGVAGDAAGRHLGVSVLVAEKRHIHTS